MSRGALPAAGLGVAALLALGLRSAPAQTLVNPGALDQLAPQPAVEAPAPKHLPRHVPAKPAAKPPSSSSPKTALRPPAKPVAPVVPKVAPPAPVLPPPITVPTRPAPPATPVPEARDAPGAATARSDGLRVTFGVGRAELSPATEAAVKALAHPNAAAPPAESTYSLTAYAGGNADDPSTPRRLSLSRALAVRTLLLGEGIPSQRIYVRALGEPPDGDPASPDRVDVVIQTAAATGKAGAPATPVTR